MKKLFVITLLVTLIPATMWAERSAAWPVDGLAVCTAANQQYFPTIASDGAGGAFITWYDSRSGGSNYDIYAQHVLASGAADPAWPADGRALCTAANGQYYPQVVSDGAGGAIVAWQDLRGGTFFDIYAQHVLASGALDPAWPADGVALCTALNNQYAPKIVSDGAGGAIVTWYDLRLAVYYDIYAQHVLASGAVDPAWPADGVAVCSALFDQLYPTIASDGAGGAIVAWYDRRSDATKDDIYAQHVLSSGAVDAAWPVDGRALCNAANPQADPRIISDGAGGAIVAWHDARSGTSYGIYAQRVLASGAVDPAWPTNGVAVCTAPIGQYYPTIVSDGGGGAIVTWQDLRNGAANYDVYAQHVLAAGAVDGTWPVNGVAVCTAGNNQYAPRIASDGSGGAFVTWYDRRSGGTNDDIYAQHVLAAGAVDATWPADGRALCAAANGQVDPEIVSDGAGGAFVTWYDLRTGTNYDIYAQWVEGAPLVSVGSPGPFSFALHGLHSNPGSEVRMSFSLPNGEPARIDLMDIAGRRVLSREVGSLGAGLYQFRSGGRENLTPGVYLVRLTQGWRSRTTKAVVVR